MNASDMQAEMAIFSQLFEKLTDRLAIGIQSTKAPSLVRETRLQLSRGERIRTSDPLLPKQVR